MKIVLIIISIFSVILINAQQPIPKNSYFHVIGNENAPVTLTAFMDFQCPDSKAAWPILQQVIQHYGSNKIQLVFNVFPLPYHHNAFFASQAAIVVAQLTNSSNFWRMADILFDQQDNWGDAPTHHITPAQVIELMSGYANKCCGVNKTTFVSEMGYVTDQNIEARAMWKLATALGIYGTPQFLVNGAYVTADATWTLQQWTTLLDPLYE